LPVYIFIGAKQGYTVRKLEKDKWIYYISVSAGLKLGTKISSGIEYRHISAHFEHWVYNVLYAYYKFQTFL
jgi:hypothetical protein